MVEPAMSAGEQQEAEALARALERGTAAEAFPSDAFETAALLRYCAGGGELSDTRQAAVLEQLLKDLPEGGAHATAATTEGGSFFGLGQHWKWLTLLGLTAVLVIGLGVERATKLDSVAGVVKSAALIHAEKKLIEEQARLVSDARGLDSAAFELTVREYRTQLLVAAALGDSSRRADLVEAHRLMDSGNVQQGMAALEAWLTSAEPETESLRSDAAFRLAQLALRSGELQTAKRWAAMGLGESRVASPGRVNLSLALGAASERLGDTAAAAAAYLEALKDHESLLKASLGDDMSPDHKGGGQE